MTTAARAYPACHTPLPEEARFCLHCGKATPTEFQDIVRRLGVPG